MYYGVGVLRTIEKVLPHKKSRKAINLSALRLTISSPYLLQCKVSMPENRNFVKCFFDPIFCFPQKLKES